MAHVQVLSLPSVNIQEKIGVEDTITALQQYKVESCVVRAMKTRKTMAFQVRFDQPLLAHFYCFSAWMWGVLGGQSEEDNFSRRRVAVRHCRCM